MGLFDWVKRALGGAPRQPTPSATQPTRAATSAPSPGASSMSVGPAGPSSVTGVSYAMPPGGQPATVASTSDARSAPARPKANDLSYLDLGQFAPISSAEAHAQAGQIGSLWTNPWFGRRDLIPPADDPRTLLIDRAMVGQGLLTPEELVQIHAVGREMDAIRPDLAQARAQADQAVRDRQQARRQLKEQKQREAAERRQRRMREVVERRQNDIVYLGRGVSKGLADRQSNVERLTSLGLPALSTPADLAAALSMSVSRLRWLAFHSEAARRTHYVTFRVPKRSGGERTLSAPHRGLRACQDWILANIVSKGPLNPAAHGFVPGRGTVTNAAPHVGREVVLNCDLTDFFPSIVFGRVKWVFRMLGYSPAVATILALLCTEAPRRTARLGGVTYHVAVGPRGLPQGAPTSPAISNLAARRLDARLAGIAARVGWQYTRYADDLTFSASGEATAKVGYLLARIRHIAQDERFAVNEKKTRVQRRNSRQSVTGVVVNERTGAPRPLVRQIRAILHQAGRHGLAAQNRDNLPHFESWIEGMISYIEMVNPKQGRPLRAAWRGLFPAS